MDDQLGGSPRQETGTAAALAATHGTGMGGHQGALTVPGQVIPAPAPQARVDAGNTHRPPSGRRARMGPYIPRGPYAEMEVDLQLKTQSAILVFEACWHLAQETFHRLSCVLQWAEKLDGALKEVDVALTKRFDAVESAMDSEVRRLKAIAESIGTKPHVRYGNVRQVSAVCFSPKQKRFADLIERLDCTIHWVDGLWFAGRINDRDRTGVLRKATNQVLTMNRECAVLRVRVEAYATRLRIGSSEEEVEEHRVGVLDATRILSIGDKKERKAALMKLPGATKKGVKNKGTRPTGKAGGTGKAKGGKAPASQSPVAAEAPSPVALAAPAG